VLDRIDVPSLAADPRGIIRWLNPAGLQLLGAVRGRTFTSAVAPHDVSRLRRAFVEWVDGGSSRVDAVLIAGTGSLIACTLSSTALVRDGLVVGVFTAITRVHRASLAPAVAPERLTPRQFEILQLIAIGTTTAEIAQTLHLSRETVRNHVRAVLVKLNAKSRLEAVAIARRDNLVVTPDRNVTDGLLH
jgi:DNA-binding CsgD family transcriptional regulator